MSTVTKPGRTVAKFVPTPAEIAASCAELDAKRLAEFDATAKRRRGADRKKRKAKANRELQQPDQSEPVDLDNGPREMTKADICNVEFINSSDLDSIFDSLIESVSFQHALEDCECRWNIADVDPEQMDLSEPKPLRDVAWPLTQRDVVPYRAKHRRASR